MSCHNLKSHYSSYGGETFKESIQSESSWKSDVNITRLGISKCSYVIKKNSEKSSSNNYEHDEIPVNKHSSRINIVGKNSDIMSITNSELENMESRIYRKISQELPTDDFTLSSLESHIILFKSTVQNIFDNFHTNMRDIEIYKKRFEEILGKNKVDSLADMRDFIIDIIQHMSSEISVPTGTDNNIEIPGTEMLTTTETKAMGDSRTQTNSYNKTEKQIAAKLLESLHSVVEAYKNDNYLTDSTFDENSSKLGIDAKKESFNIYFLGGLPCIKIKMNDRNLMSEINIKNPRHKHKEYNVASADNLKKLRDKKLDIDKYDEKSEDNQVLEREIPVKVSFAKKNISLNEDLSQEKDKDENKSLMSKICSYICKKLRKY